MYEKKWLPEYKQNNTNTRRERCVFLRQADLPEKDCTNTWCRPFNNLSTFASNWKRRSISKFHTNSINISRIVSLWDFFCIYFLEQERSISWSHYDVWWKMDSVRQQMTICAMVGRFFKPKLHQKNVIVTVWWSAASIIHHYSFLNPGETITAEKYCEKIDET